MNFSQLSSEDPESAKALVATLQVPDSHEQLCSALWYSANQINHINQVTGRLYAQFQFSGGEKKLAGCQLVNRLILVFCNICVCNSEAGDTATVQLEQIVEVREADGTPMADRTISELELEETIKDCLALLDRSRGEMLGVGTELQQAEFESALQLQSLAKPVSSANLVIAASIPWVEGKFQFSCEDQFVESHFSGWADLLVRNPSRCQPYLCPLTQLSGKELVADDEGDISVEAALETCSVSGRRLLRSKLFQCGNSQRWASREYRICATDGVNGMLNEAATYCSQCGLPVLSRDFVKARLCVQCDEINSSSALTEVDDLLWLNRLLEKIKSAGATRDQSDWRMVRNSRLVWLLDLSGQKRELFVFDLLDDLVVHRVQSRWIKRWSDAKT